MSWRVRTFQMDRDVEQHVIRGRDHHYESVLATWFPTLLIGVDGGGSNGSRT